MQTGFGTLTALTDLSLTVHTEHGDLTCTLNDRSPRLGDFHVGDKVKVACTSGALTAIAKVVVTTITTGVLTAVSDRSVTVLSDGGERTCTRTSESPSLDAYHVGDKVKMTCTNGALTGIAKADTYQGGLGTITALADSSVTVHTDGGDVTCKLGDGSPSLAGFHVGDNVKVYCRNGVLTSIATLQSGSGTLAALSDSSLTVHTETGDLTCKLGDGSPNVGEYHVGDKVKVTCTNGVLTTIARADTYQGGLGAITALSDSSLTVHTDGGDLTCTLNDASPKLGDYRVGDKVKLYCKNGALISIAKVETTVTAIMSGRLSVVSPTSLTVLTDGGEKTCSRNGTSPSLDGYQVGNYVKATCTNGALTAIAHL